MAAPTQITTLVFLDIVRIHKAKVEVEGEEATTLILSNNSNNSNNHRVASKVASTGKPFPHLGSIPNCKYGRFSVMLLLTFFLCAFVRWSWFQSVDEDK